MHRILIAAAALSGVAAVAFVVRRYLGRNRRDDAHWAAMRRTLGIKPGAGVAMPGSGGEASKPSVGNDAGANKDAGKTGLEPSANKGQEPPAKKGPGTALMLHPDADGLKVNGLWLQTMNCTMIPEPLHDTRYKIESALERARRHNNACNEARKRRDWDEAEGHLDKARAEVARWLRNDHWVTAEVLNQQGCLSYERGNYTEAREIWWQAEEVASEWPTKCAHIINTIRENLALVKKQLGF